MLFAGIFLAFVVVLDIALLVSLIRPGDERRQMIVWKASTAAFGGMVGSFVFCIVENCMRQEYEGMNPFTTLTTAATMYFLFLLFFKRKYGD